MDFPNSIFDYPIIAEQWVNFAKLFINYGVQLFFDFKTKEKDNYQIGKIEFSTSSSLHRGYYHPSPVYDIVIGNTKRGKLVQKPSKNDNIAYRYIFDPNDVMRCIEIPYQNGIVYTEYLVYTENKRYGITINKFGRLEAIAEEVFSDNRLINFTLANYNWDRTKYQCFDFRTEAYQYDDNGLAMCAFRKLSPQSGMRTIDDVIHFERANGYLCSYTLFHADQLQQAGRVYTITKKRKSYAPTVNLP